MRKRTKGRPKPPLPQCTAKFLLNTEIGENLGLGFVDCQQVVAYGAILRKGLAFLGDVVTIVTAEASGIAHVPDVIGVSSPGDLHLRKTVGCEDGHEAFSCSFDQVGMSRKHIGVFAAVELGELQLESFRAPRLQWRNCP